MRLAILLSGRGSNFEAIHRAFADQIVCVISNRPEAAGLKKAREFGLTAHTIDHRKFATREAHEEEVLRVLAEAQPDFICL
ncbi:MAG TPA: formyltransferase family protein, partial [Thermoanaerobaculia bacterium]